MGHALILVVERDPHDPDVADGLDVLYSSPVELQIDSIIVDLLRRIESRGIRRVVLDAVGDLAASTLEPHRLHDYLYSLIQHLAVNGITSIFTFETAGTAVTGGEQQAGPISYMSDNLVVLDMREEKETRRSVRVLKTRGSAHDPTVREIAIGPAGVALR